MSSSNDHESRNSQWHVIVQARPPAAKPGPRLLAGGKPVATLDLGGQAATGLLPVSFDWAFGQLEKLDLFIEGDGSFCWTAPQAAWRIYGELYDGGERLVYAELKGYCPPAAMEQVLCAFADDPSQLMIQLVREGVYVSVEEFLRWAYSPA